MISDLVTHNRMPGEGLPTALWRVKALRLPCAYQARLPLRRPTGAGPLVAGQGRMTHGWAPHAQGTMATRGWQHSALRRTPLLARFPLVAHCPPRPLPWSGRPHRLRAISRLHALMRQTPQKPGIR
jgi:hypothetical protein